MVFTMFLIFAGAAVFSTVALFTRQSLLVAYMVLGVILGPWGLKLISDPEIAQKTGDFGIIFLLFLLGLHLQPQNLLHMLKKATWITTASSFVFAVMGFLIGYFFNYTVDECVIIGIAMMFSSTIIGLKLLPTTVLHHQHIGEVVISILLLQDLLAILVLMFLHAASIGLVWTNIALVTISLPALLLFAFLFQHFVVAKLFAYFDRIREYIFLLAIAWCLSISVLAQLIGLTYEIGAFIAGVTIAEGRIALYIAESLKPLRDFFLVLFFFSVGAEFDLQYLTIVMVPAIILASLVLVLKPITFWALLRKAHESKHVAWEIGWRLGQISEFSLLIGYIATRDRLISDAASYLIQATAIITFIASSYIVVMRYPTPVAMSDKLRRE